MKSQKSEQKTRGRKRAKINEQLGIVWFGDKYSNNKISNGVINFY